MIYNLPKDLITCFEKAKAHEIRSFELEDCLQDIAKQVLNIGRVPVRVVDDGYKDVFNNLFLDVENGKLVLRNYGIYVDEGLFDSFEADELAAVFLYEVAIFDAIRKHSELSKWITVFYGSAFSSTILGLLGGGTTLSQNIFSKTSIELPKTENPVNIKSYYIIYSIFAVLMLNILIFLFSRVKIHSYSKTAVQYVVKYDLSDAYKRFLQKHERPLYIYMFGVEKYIPLHKFINAVQKMGKQVLNIISDGKTDQERGLAEFCAQYKAFIELYRKFNIPEGEVVKKAKETWYDMCKGKYDRTKIEFLVAILDKIKQLFKLNMR